MSIQLMSAVWADQSLTNQGELLVMLALADFANDEGCAWPSLDTLAKKSRFSRRSVQYIIRKLLASKHITKDAGGNGPKDTNTYKIRVQELHPMGAIHDNKGATGGIKGCKTVAPDPSLTVSTNRQGTHFKKPTIQEVKEYTKELKLPPVEADKFYDHYESNGWKVGRTGMKDWRGALRNWKRNWQEWSGGDDKQPSLPSVGTSYTEETAWMARM